MSLLETCPQGGAGNIWKSEMPWAVEFGQEFAPKRRVLNEVMIFNPHYASWPWAVRKG